ncbi:MAG TPA: hypothetical protein VFC83_03480 [Erysipelotrichaceae bacterium]|nr:hypothetical protein [Erysipelotrichaceae bacterium]
MSNTPKFKIKRRGYDRSSVEAHISKLKQELDFSEAKLDVYKKQLDFLTVQLEVKQDQCLNLINELKLMQSSVERMVLPEEVSLYVNNDEKVLAQKTADEIILEALLIAKEILDNLSHTAMDTKQYKEELIETLQSITKSVIDIDVIEPLVIDWLNEEN